MSTAPTPEALRLAGVSDAGWVVIDLDAVADAIAAARQLDEREPDARSTA